MYLIISLFSDTVRIELDDRHRDKYFFFGVGLQHSHDIDIHDIFKVGEGHVCFQHEERHGGDEISNISKEGTNTLAKAVIIVVRVERIMILVVVWISLSINFSSIRILVYINITRVVKVIIPSRHFFFLCLYIQSLHAPCIVIRSKLSTTFRKS